MKIGGGSARLSTFLLQVCFGGCVCGDAPQLPGVGNGAKDSPRQADRGRHVGPDLGGSVSCSGKQWDHSAYISDREMEVRPVVPELSMLSRSVEPGCLLPLPFVIESRTGLVGGMAMFLNRGDSVEQKFRPHFHIRVGTK
jgi:hypothetical protein